MFGTMPTKLKKTEAEEEDKELPPFEIPAITSKVFSYLLEWNYAGGSEGENFEIALPMIPSLRITCKSFNQAFKEWGGWKSVYKNLLKERKWKLKQEDNLSYAIGCRIEPTIVGMLKFETKEDCDKFMVELRDRIVSLDRRTNFLARKMQNPALVHFRTTEVPRTIFDLLF